MKKQKAQKAKTRIRFEKRDARGIPLTEIIAVHRQFAAPEAIPDNLGDGFLYAWNPVFRNIRNEYRARGFGFSNEDCCNYFAFPLMSLDDVIAAKTIPYRRNFPWLEILAARAPEKFTLTELKRSELSFNYLLHESAHFIAHSVFFGSTHLKDVPKNPDSLLKILLGEAFANTVECVSSVFVQGELSSYFLDANCYFRSDAKEVATILRFAKKFGFEAVTCILLGAFLYSNFMYEKFGKKEEQLIFKFSGITSKVAIGPLVRIGFTLSEQFRTTTTHLHLMKLGFPVDLEKLIKFDPMARLLDPKNADLRTKVDQLTQILSRCLDSAPLAL